LTVEADLQPVDGSPAGSAMQARASARIQPWQAQPVAEATGEWHALDLAALWPGLPHTRLGGSARLQPRDGGWQATAQVNNAASGPWDRGRLPVDSLQADIGYSAGQWTLHMLQARGAGGQLQARGHWRDHASTRPQAPAWQGQATLQGINPAALHSALAAAALDGQLTASPVAQGLRFDAGIRPASANASARAVAPGPAGLRLDRAELSGQWQGDTVRLDRVLVEGADARLQGQLEHRLASRATHGQLQLQLPGAQADLQGRLAAADGAGDIRLRVTDAGPAWRWLARWPGLLPAALARTGVQGAAEFAGRWQGGWHPSQGATPQLQGALRLPRLELQPEGAPPALAWHLQDVQADLSGPLDALQLALRGRARQATRQFELQAQASGGRVNATDWQGRLDSARLALQDSLQPGSWTAQLGEPVGLRWTRQRASHALELAAGQVRLTGPLPGNASVSWQAAHWLRRPAETSAAHAWRSQGRIQDLPLAWLALAGPAALQGLRGDMRLGGDWDAAIDRSLRLRATLARTSGDLSLAGDDAGGDIRAGVREARVTLTADDEQLSTQLQWDSEHAGQARADIGTRLRRDAAGWHWPGDAALTGTLRAQLPRVGVWSVLAPPGWRLRGTLNAEARLAGTRSAPQWRGTLQADDLAVRSVVDGIEFSQGTLRASLQGERLVIDRFSLRGASGAGGDGGSLTASGFVQWLPANPAAGAPLSRLRMELDAQATALRVSARADRRLAVSGQVQARLADARLSLRGTLKADQALFILPEDTAPSLGADVVVRARGGPAQPGPGPAAPATAGVRVVPEVALTLDLGPDFQLRGRGLATRLAGTLDLRSSSPTGLVPRLAGELRTVRGSYKAYGQQLDIEQGLLRFAGPYDNPALDILAIRPNLSQRVGVQISGTALSPRVRLYAEPDLPDADKLAWLVLGRGAATGGAESAVLQQAALALLGGNGKGLSGGLAEALGLDELSVRGAASSADGSTTTGATVTVGKRLSRNFYVAYERSLAGTLGTFSIFYDLSRRLTLRAQTGEQSAVDLIFTVPYD
jgi:translocation and assembly module TamB